MYRRKPNRGNNYNYKKSVRDEESTHIKTLLKKLKGGIKETDVLEKFTELPISNKTLKGLKESDYVIMTDIQKKALPLCLCGRDVLAAAKTGSGKTLAFLIPVLESLYTKNWGSQDGLGALILSPTRELAVQIFRVLCKIGKYHNFSAGLVIGGKDLKIEREGIANMNILIGTPGRLLQHMDENPSFDASNLKVLVLDEADRILDLGFQESLNAIISFLPSKTESSRQTMLFSATQTKSVRDLSRLSLSEPDYVGVYKTAEFSTPANLTQHYMEVELHKKVDTLFAFIKTHSKAKAIVFMSSCKQVKFLYESFKSINVGSSILPLFGKQKQSKRVEVFSEFITSPHAFLFCTDIAARGLDFPAVDWVIQMDCPIDAATYVHRVGRTARYDSSGSALLFLLPIEVEPMLKSLNAHKIPIEAIRTRVPTVQSTRLKLQTVCFQNPEIKYLGQRAFISYLRSLHLQQKKLNIDISRLPINAFSEALGLPGCPKVNFMKRNKKTDSKKDENEDISSTIPIEKPKGSLGIGDADEEEEDDDFITIKRADHQLSDGEDSLDENLPATNSRWKTKTSKAAFQGEKLVFDDDGVAHPEVELEDGLEFSKSETLAELVDERLKSEKQKLLKEDELDKRLEKEKSRAKKLSKKLLVQTKDNEEYDSEEYLSEDDEVKLMSDLSEEENVDDNEEPEVPLRKRKQTPSDAVSSKKRSKVIQLGEPETLEDQEALALRLLGGN